MYACIVESNILYPLFFSSFFVESLEVFFSEHEGVGEVFFPYDFVCCEFLGFSLEEDSSLEEEVGPVGDGEGLLHVVVGYQYADVAVLEPPYNMLDILYGNRVNTSERLVEHYELRVYGQATRNLCTAALATGELVTLVLANLVQTELGKQTLKPLLTLLLVEVGHFKYRHDIVLYSHLAEHARLLRQIANTGTVALEPFAFANIYFWSL